jgi:hypothetical protein
MTPNPDRRAPVAARTIKTAEPAAPEYDFDSWTEEDEQKAIAALVPDVRYIIVEGDFIGRFVDGTTVRMTLSISLDDVNELTADSADPVDQLTALLRKLAGDAAAAEFTSHNLAETIVMAEKFFKVFTRISQASLPES